MRTIIRISTIALSIVIAVVLYTHFYSIDLSEKSLQENISKRMDAKVTINDYKEIDKYTIVNFEFSKNHIAYEGYITLIKGLNSKYKLGDGYYEAATDKLIFTDFELSENHYLIIFGSSIKTDVISITSRGENIQIPVDSNHVFNFIESDHYVASITDYSYIEDNVTFYVAVDNEIRPIINHDGELNSGPEKIVLVSSLLIVLIGLVISFLFTPERNKLEALYFKLTKHGPEDNDNDPNDYMMLQ